jgi:glutamate-1-semialdehyde 2,1-aminomutase
LDTEAPERPRDAELRRRARAVIPGGMYGHLNMSTLPPDYPQFFASGRGARVVDVDGREFVDLMCSWGPVLLGHQHPEVEEAASRQAALGDCLDAHRRHRRHRARRRR